MLLNYTGFLKKQANSETTIKLFFILGFHISYFLIKVELHSRGSTEFSNQQFRQIFKKFLSYDRTYLQYIHTS